MKKHLHNVCKSAIISTLLLLTTTSKAQLVITNQGGTATAIINGFVGQGLIVSNPVINCPNSAYGNFSNGNTTNLGVTNGAALTTGDLTDVPQSASNFMSTSNGNTCNDPQLQSLEPSADNDCCILEFDIVPYCTQLSIRFAFGSEEYLNWVSQGYNDAFGFFITGPNPAGGNYNNKNIAVLPNGTIASIDNINAGANSSYYVNNGSGSTIVFGGFTTPITSTLNLVPCGTYHFKMAIADAGDHIFDSGVFIDFLQCTNVTTLTMNSTASSCGGNTGTANVSVANGFGPFTYTWSPAPGGGQGTTSVTGLTAGTTYTVTVDDAYACIPPVTATVTIGGSPTPTVTVPANISVCAGDNIPAANFVTVPVGASVAWTNSNAAIGLPASGSGNINSFIAANSTSTPITSTIIVTPSLPGCPGTPVSYTITVNPIPSVTVNSPTICNGNQATLVATPSITGGNYAWAILGGSTASSINVNPSVTTSYTVSYSLSGCSSTGTGTVFVNPNPTITANGATSCSGIPAQLTANTTSSGGTYLWMPSGLTTSSIIVSATASTTYTVTYTLNNCTTTTTTVLTINPTPSVSVSNIIICDGQSGTLTANPSATGGTYYWTPGGSTSSSININPSSTTNYTVSYTLNGCSGTASATAVVNPPLNLGVGGNNTICEGSSTNLSATAFNGNGGPYSYSWTPSTGLNNASIANPSASPSSTTTYTVTATDNCSKPISATVTIMVNPAPNPVFTADVTSGCAPLCVNFTDASSIATGNIADWEWNFGDGTTSTLQNPQHCYNNPGVYSVSLISISAARCTDTIVYANLINVYSTPIADFSIPTSTSILNSTITFYDNSIGATSWDWNFGDAANSQNNNSTLQNPEHTYDVIGNYCITLIVNNDHKCSDTTVKCMNLFPESTFFVPNAFSPNGDGKNDDFYGKGENIINYEMFIYDRWGDEIFYSDNMNKHWDGKANKGKDVAQQDIYIYLINIIDINGQKHKLRGTVALLK